MRFGVSKRISKNVSVGFSTSGPNIRFGGKNFGVRITKDGPYLTARIPGTSLHVERRVAHKPKKKSVSRYNANIPQGRYDFKYHNDGSVTFYDGVGREVENEVLIRNIKKSDQYKREIKRLSSERLSEDRELQVSFTHVEYYAVPVTSLEDNQKMIDNISCQPYEWIEYDVACPTMQDIEETLKQEAKQKISPLKMFKRNKLIQEYIDEYKEERYQSLFTQWSKDKEEYDKKQNEKATKYNLKELVKMEAMKKELQALMNLDKEAIKSSIDTWLESVTFPFSFAVQYEIYQEKIYVDLDLPEIEDLPQTFIKSMANGTVKKTKKTVTMLNEDYKMCVAGLSLFIATHFLNCAIGTTEIIVSGYTQRKNKQGEIVDEYIYSIKYDRKTLSVFEEFDDPCLAFEFEHIADIKNNHAMKKITPYSFKEV